MIDINDAGLSNGYAHARSIAQLPPKNPSLPSKKSS